MVAFAAPAVAGPKPTPTTTTTAPPVTASPVATPDGVTVTGGTWISVRGGNGATMLAAIFRPADGRPHPGVLVLHGTGGFLPQNLQLAKDLAAKGFVAMAACWFAGHWEMVGLTSVKPATPSDAIPCPQAQVLDPKLPVPAAMLNGIQPLVTALRKQAGVNGKVAIFGHSRGSIATFQLGAAKTGDALVGSGGFPIGLAPITQPVLMLQGTNDPFSPMGLTKTFEAGLKGPKQAVYYPGGGHLVIYEDATHADAVSKAAAFLHKYLGA